MIIRSWTTGLKLGCGHAYETFANEVSLPMFQGHEGFLGCVMSRSEKQGIVLTFWRDHAAVAGLERSTDYKKVAAEILAADVLEGPQATFVQSIHLCELGRVERLP